MPVQRLQRFLIGAWVGLLVLALYPYTFDPAGPIKNLVTAFAAFLLGLTGLYGALFCGVGFRLRSPTLWLVGAFLAVNVVAGLLSDHRANSLEAVRPWIACAVIAVFAARVYRRPEQVWRLLAVIVAVMSVSSLYGFSQKLGYDPFPWATRGIEEYRGLPSTFANPNFAGHALVLGICMSVGLVFRPRGGESGTKRPWGFPAGALFGVLTLILSGHFYLTRMRGGRVALGAAIAMLVVFALVRRAGPRPARAAVITFLVFIVLGIAGAGVTVYGIRTANRNTALPIDGSLVLRCNGYYGAGAMLLDHAVIGIGPGNYALENIPYWTGFEQRWFAEMGKKNTHVHCDALEAGIDAGVPGAALYFGLLIWAILNSLALTTAALPEMRRLGYVLAACFTAFAVDGQFGFNLRVPVSAGLFFLILGVLEGMLVEVCVPRASRITGAILVLVLAGTCAVFEMRSFRAEHLFQKAEGAQYWAEQLKDEGNTGGRDRAWAEAYALLQEGRAYLAWDYRFPEKLGQIDLACRRFETASFRFEEALDRNPHHPGIMSSLAQSYINQAIELFEKPDEARLAASVGFRDFLKQAQLRADQALSLCPFLPQAHEALGRIALLQGQASDRIQGDSPGSWTQAVDHFLAALRYGAPNRAAVHRMLGQAYVRLNEPERAEESFTRAADSEPTDLETWRLFRLFARETGRNRAFTDALGRNLSRLKKGTPRPVDALAALSIELAEAYADSQANTALAQQVLAGALEYAPGHLSVWGAYSRLLAREDRLSALQQALVAVQEKAVHSETLLPPVLTALARTDLEPAAWLEIVSRTLGETAESSSRRDSPAVVARDLCWIADLVAERTENAPPEVAGKALADLGGVYAAGEQWEAAEGVLRRALALLPESMRAAALVHHSEALAALGRLDEALTAAREASRLAANNPAVRWNLARRLAAAGRVAEAKLEYTALMQQTNATSPAMSKIQAEYEAVISGSTPERTP